MSYLEHSERKHKQFTHLAVCNSIFAFVIIFFCFSEFLEDVAVLTISDRTKDVLAAGFGVALFYFLVVGLKMLAISLLDEVDSKFTIKSKE